MKILHLVELCWPHATMLEPNHLTAHSTGITKVKRDSLDIPWLDIECFISYPKSDELKPHVNRVSYHSYVKIYINIIVNTHLLSKEFFGGIKVFP